jgi:hypothetical protein
MVVRIATWNMENLFKPPNKFGPKTQQEYNAKLDALAAARPDPRHRARGNTAQTRTLWAAVGHAAPPDTLWVSEAGSNEFPITSGIRPGNPFSHLSAAAITDSTSVPAWSSKTVAPLTYSLPC